MVLLLVCIISASTLSKFFCRLSFSSGASDWRGDGGAIGVAKNFIEDRKVEITVRALTKTSARTVLKWMMTKWCKFQTSSFINHSVRATNV